MFSLHRNVTSPSELPTSKLFNELTFYPEFLKDLGNCRSEVIIRVSFCDLSAHGSARVCFSEVESAKS